MEDDDKEPNMGDRVGRLREGNNVGAGGVRTVVVAVEDRVIDDVLKIEVMKPLSLPFRTRCIIIKTQIQNKETIYCLYNSWN